MQETPQKIYETTEIDVDTMFTLASIVSVCIDDGFYFYVSTATKFVPNVEF